MGCIEHRRQLQVSMRRLLSALAVAALTLGGCNVVSEFLDSVEQGRIAEKNDEQLVEKLSGYVDCFNRDAIGQLQEASNAYVAWAKAEDGSLRTDGEIGGMAAVEFDAECPKQVEAANATDPDAPQLEAAATTWMTTYATAHELARKAHDYYDRKEYEDDDFAKGKAMHEPLLEALDAFETAHESFATILNTKNTALMERMLVRLKKDDDQQLAYHDLNVTLKAEFLNSEVNALEELATIDEAKFDAALNAYEAALQDAQRYSTLHPIDTSLADFDALLAAAGEYLVVAHALREATREDIPFEVSVFEDAFEKFIVVSNDPSAAASAN